MSAEEHYLNAIEALEQGDRETAEKEAKAAQEREAADKKAKEEANAAILKAEQAQ